MRVCTHGATLHIYLCLLVERNELRAEVTQLRLGREQHAADFKRIVEVYMRRIRRGYKNDEAALDDIADIMGIDL